MTCDVVMIIVLVSLTTLRHFWLEGLQWRITCFVGSTFLAKLSAVGRKRKYHKVNYAMVARYKLATVRLVTDNIPGLIYIPYARKFIRERI